MESQTKTVIEKKNSESSARNVLVLAALSAASIGISSALSLWPNLQSHWNVTKHTTVPHHYSAAFTLAMVCSFWHVDNVQSMARSSPMYDGLYRLYHSPLIAHSMVTENCLKLPNSFHLTVVQFRPTFDGVAASSAAAAVPSFYFAR